MFDDNPSNVAKASISILDGDRAGSYAFFPINPDSLIINHGAKYVDHPIPGESQPRSQWVHGTVRSINFTIPLIARACEFQSAPGPCITTTKQSEKTKDCYEPEDVAPSLGDTLLNLANFVQSLVLPRKFTSTGGGLAGDVHFGPPPILLVWGRRLSFRCIVRTVKLNYVQFERHLDPIRGTLDVALTHQPERTSFFDDFIFDGDSKAVGSSVLQPLFLTGVGG